MLQKIHINGKLTYWKGNFPSHKGMQIKAIMTYNFTPPKLATIKVLQCEYLQRCSAMGTVLFCGWDWT